MAKEQQKEADLSRIETRELVEELRKREGVETKIAGPYEDITVTVNGPAIVLVVMD
ncbi:MAG: BC1881 family protein [Ruminococcus sp.]|nr:BC1881 family protein [Ruminococcus sp.]